LLSVFKDGGPGGRTFAAPVPVVCITPEFFRSQGHESFLEHVAEVAARRGHIHVSFARRPFQGAEFAAAWLPRSVAVQCVTLNLPKAAYRSGDLQRLFQELDRLSEVVVRAQLDKRAFIKELLERRSLGPLGLLAVEREGQPYFDPDRAVYLVGVAGLNECVQALTCQELHVSEDAVRLAVRIAEHLSARIDQYGEDQDIDLVLSQTTCPEVLRRLATMDLREFPDQARHVVKTDLRTQDIFYTAGAQLNAAYECSPIERVRIEGQFHEWFHGEAVTSVRPPDDETAKESIAAFIKKAYFQTQTHRIAFTPPASH
jgi:ribonucleoside-triphosphate reductase